MAAVDIDFPSLAQTLVRISPAARLAYDSQGYLLNVEEDDLTPEGIVEALLPRLVDDLSNVGLRLTVEISELCAGWPQVRQLISLSGLLLADDLTTTLRHDTGLALAVGRLLQGGDGLDQPLITAYLTLLSDGRLPYYAMRHGAMAETLIDNITSDVRFQQHLQTVYDEALQISTEDLDPEQLTAYLQEIGLQRQHFFGLVARLAPAIGEAAAARLEAIFQAYVQTVTAQDMLPRFSWMAAAVTTGVTQLSIQETAIYNKYRRQFAVSTPLHPEWWSVAAAPAALDALGMVLMQLATRKLETPSAMDLGDAISRVTRLLKMQFEDYAVPAEAQRQLLTLVEPAHEEA